MKNQDKTNPLESRLEAYFKLSKSLTLKPASNAKTILPIGAAMFGMLSALDAQIIYSGTQNVNCNLGGASARCYANINLAGGNDFSFHRNHVAAQVFIQVDEVPGGGFDLNGFHAQVAGNYVYPYANVAGVAIGAAGPWGFQAGQANSLSDNGFYPNHKWESLPNGTTRFMGFRGTMGGNTHYGWMRLTRNSFGNYTIVDWAYNNTANQQILTGQTTSGTSDLSLTMSSNNGTPATGALVTFTLTVANAGPDAATNASIKNIVPSGLSYVSNSQTGPGTYDQSSPSGTGLRWNNLMIPSGSSLTLTFQATVVASSGNITNFAQVQSSDQSDPDSTPGNK